MLLLMTLLSVAPEPAPVFKCDRDASQLTLDLGRSTVRWRGTKFFGLGKHEGTVRFLQTHLLGPDFFDVSEHPVARFLIRRVQEEKPRLYQVTGDLTIRGRTHPATFYVRGWTVTDTLLRGEARIEVERHKYGVSYRGSTIKDDLVDDTFWLELSIEARSARSAG